MDDIKLFAKDEENLEDLMSETKRILQDVGLQLNKKKSATNCLPDNPIAEILQEHNTYKYLGFDETKNGAYSNKTLQRVEDEMMKRIDLLLGTKLNAKNLFTGLNEWAISLVDYMSGVFDIPRDWGVKMDRKLRKKLSHSRIYVEAAAIERLYLPRKELGRGLISIDNRIESSVLNFWTYLNKTTLSEVKNSRKRVIMKNEEHRNSRISRSFAEASTKYSTCNVHAVKKAQKASLFKSISKKKTHSLCMNNFHRHGVSQKASAVWLRKGNISPQTEGSLTLLQDRNLFWLNDERCNTCSVTRNVDHVATRCRRLVSHEYKRRHDEATRCIALKLSRMYSFTKTRRVRNFRVGDILENERAKLYFDVHIKTPVYIKHNRPDIVVIDKAKRQALIIEVGISSDHEIRRVEKEKFDKYLLLADEIQTEMHLKEVKILPIVITWDGMMLRRSADNMKLLMTETEAAYIQTCILKRTLESMTLYQRRHSNGELSEAEDTNDAHTSNDEMEATETHTEEEESEDATTGEYSTNQKEIEDNPAKPDKE